ncbi:MAG: AAA family ATPase [Deltaproteobacteria bacterium]|nr:AAA family ATPase [Deltaproteobacteria bacterium]
MNATSTLNEPARRRLQAHFALTRIPFRKSVLAQDMFDSRSQRDLLHGLEFWAEVRGLAVVTGPSGVGKSITLRRFVQGLDQARYRVVHVNQVPTTLVGFLRTINRALGLPMRMHAADLFDQAHAHLTAHGEEGGAHSVLVLDDAEGVRAELLDVLRRLTAWALDAEDRFSVLVTGTEALTRTLRDPVLEPFLTRVTFAATLKPFSVEDTRNYIRFHVQRAGGRDKLFSDAAVQKVFAYSQGMPRRVNQLALHTLIQAAVLGHEEITGDFVQAQVIGHPIYDPASAS